MSIFLSLPVLPRLAVRRLALVLLTLLSALPLAAWSSSASDIIGLLARAGLGAPHIQHETLHGVAVVTADFVAAARPAQVASRLSGWGHFGRVFALPGQIMLSGMEGSRHWLAILQGQPEGTQGRVSVMTASASAGSISPQPLAGKLAAVVQGMPATRLLDHHLPVDKRSVQQHAWRILWPPHRVMQHVEHHLQQHGGQRITPHSTTAGGFVSWQMRTHKLDVLVAPHGPHAMLYVQATGADP